MFTKTASTFGKMWPVMVSFGFLGVILALISFLGDLLWQKIERMLYCTVMLKYDDDTFKWVNKYLSDKGHIKGDGTLKCRKKRVNLEWWEEIFIARDDK